MQIGNKNRAHSALYRSYFKAKFVDGRLTEWQNIIQIAKQKAKRKQNIVFWNYVPGEIASPVALN